MKKQICTNCRIEKPLNDYYYMKKEKRYKRICKACFINQVVENQRKNWERHKAYKRKLYQENREQELLRKILSNSAHGAVAYACKTGRLSVPTCCEKCGMPGSVEAHHHNGYDKAHWLDVQWLCLRCHGLAHSKYREERTVKQLCLI